MMTIPAEPSRPPDRRETDSPFGVLAFLPWNHEWNRFHYKDIADIERAARMMREAGIGIARIDFLWSDLEPERGRFDFARYDAIVDALTKHEIRILGILQYNPAWSEGPWNRAPDPEAFVTYVREVVAHYKDRVKYWQVWNEPDHEIYWQPQDELAAYGALLKKCYPVIKQLDPTATVVMGGLSRDWAIHLRRLYRQAGRDAFDVVSIHPFVAPGLPNSKSQLTGVLRAVKKVMQEFKDERKPIWLTEIGCPGISAGQKSAGWWLGPSPSESEQASWLAAVYETALKEGGVQKVFWAFFRDTDRHFQNDIDYFGIIRKDFSPKPAYETYRKLSRQAPGAASAVRPDVSTTPPRAPDSDASRGGPSR